MSTTETIIIPEWKSYGSEKEILAERVKNNRDYLINIRFSRKKRHFARKLQSSKVDTMDTFKFFPSFKDPRFVEMRRERSIGVQWTVDTRDQAMQTPWYRTCNSATQVSINSASSCDSADEDLEVQVDLDDGRLLQLLREKELEMKYALGQNVNVEIFKDDFAELYLDDSFIDKKSESQLREHAGLSNSEFAKKKKITSIHWQPKAKGVIAFGSIDSRQLEKRVALDIRSQNEERTSLQSSYVIVWNFNDPIWPQVVLESPCDVQCIEFNPTEPRILAGGLVNGQVAIWDLSEADLPEQRIIDMSGNEKVTSHIKILRWKQLSLIEASHDAPVYGLHWISNKVFNDSGELITSSATNQFFSVSSDGKLFVWDKDEDFVLPSKKAMKMKSERLRGKWTPVNTWNICTRDLTSSLSCCSMHYVGEYTMYFGTHDGELVIADLSPIERKSSMLDEEHGSYKTFNTVNIAKSISQAHYSAVHSVHAHPFFGDILVSIGTYEFHVWKVGCKTPIWSSPFRDLSLTSGTWSPTRPSVLFLGRQDGVLEVWDFLDKSHVPCVENVVYQNVELTCIEFLKTNNKYNQCLAVGTSQGFLHVFEVPRNLVRPGVDESSQMRSFFDREETKVQYYERRFELHKQNAEEMKRERAFKLSEQDSMQQQSNEGELSQERKLELEKLFREMTMRDSASLLSSE